MVPGLQVLLFLTLHLLQNTGPVFYFTYQSSHLLQVFLLISS